jgi:hypothetical protein
LKISEGLANGDALKAFSPKEDGAFYVDLTEENTNGWQIIIKLYCQGNRAVSESALSAGEIVGFYYNLQDRRRLEEKD